MTKSQFVETGAPTSNDFLTRSLNAVTVDTRSGITTSFAEEVKFIKDNSPNQERAGAWADKVLKTEEPPKTAPTVRRNTPGSGMKG
jgi:hypothetical protein